METMNKRVYLLFICLSVLFVQNILYTINLIEIIPWTWLRKIVDNYSVFNCGFFQCKFGIQ